MIPSAPWVPSHGHASCAPYGIRWRTLCVALLCVAFSVAQVFSTSSVVFHDSLVVYDDANTSCKRSNGGLAVTPSTGYLSVVTLSALGNPVWLGAQELTPERWWWLGGLLTSPILFYSNNICVFGPCPWATGEPKAGNSYLRLLTVFQSLSRSFFFSSNRSLLTRYECEIPYASTFTCFTSSGGTEYDVVTRACQRLGGYLATVPSFGAWSAILATSSCASLSDARIGADDYDADVFTTMKFTVSRRGFFHWRWGPLGAEWGGKGRLLSSGAYPNTQLYGFPTLPYASGQPTLASSQNTIEVIMPQAQLNDRTWRLAAGVPSYICEMPASLVPAGSCFSTPNVFVTSATVSGCRVSGGRIVVNGTLIMDGVTMEDTVIEVDGGGTRTLNITRSTLTNVGILLKGQFSGGSEVRVTDSIVTVTSRLDLQQSANVAAWMHIDGSFDPSCAVTVLRNAIVMDITAPDMSCAMIYSGSPLLLSSSALVVSENSVRLASVGPWTAFLRSDGIVTLSGQSSIVVTDNTATIQSAAQALFVYLLSLTVSAVAVVDVSDNAVTLTGVRGTFFTGDITVDGRATWLHNTVRYGQTVPAFLQSALVFGGVFARAVLSENVMTASRVQIPTLELSGPVSGPGTLALGCTAFFGVVFLTLQELRGIVPAFDRIVLEPCTTRFVPIIEDGSSVDSTTASSVSSTTSMVIIIVGSVVAFVALVLLALIVVVLLRRRREVSQRRRYAKSTSQSELSGISRSSRRSSRTSLTGSSRGNRRPSSRSSQSASSVVTGTTASQSAS